ncbi:MAG: GNAT family N-acetyltransferase [Gammaproteobacteria bacterium]|nr:GNAT family N-acetyltransferase [Gammaproteobacteria bacterium]NKB62802.1 GNAT family N-acetyltransferase [Gammaproteobacteria bacterium]
MQIFFDDKNIRSARMDELPTVIEILSESFKDDPHMNWILEQSRYSEKINVVIEYQVKEAFNTGCVLVTKDLLGASLWNTESRENLTIDYIKRNISFILKLGLRTAIRSLKDKEAAENKHTGKKYFYLSAIGVLPQGRGKGLASKLMDPLLEHCKKHNFPVYLETANDRNVKIYSKKGFVETGISDKGCIKIHYMECV